MLCKENEFRIELMPTNIVQASEQLKKNRRQQGYLPAGLPGF